MEKVAVVFAFVLFFGGIFLYSVYESNLRHECRMEALKALVDPSKVKEICG
jgi:hypothetical protein